MKHRKYPSGNELDEVEKEQQWKRITNAMMQMTGCNRNDSSLRRPCRFRITSAWYTVTQSVSQPFPPIAVIPDNPCWILRKINLSHSNEKSQFHWLLMAVKILFLPPLRPVECFPFYSVIIVCNPFPARNILQLCAENRLCQCKRRVEWSLVKLQLPLWPTKNIFYHKMIQNLSSIAVHGSSLPIPKWVSCPDCPRESFGIESIWNRFSVQSTRNEGTDDRVQWCVGATINWKENARMDG